MKYVGIIPARYASTRFPGKPLALLGGKPIIEHVYAAAHKALDDVYVATDDERIAAAVRAFGGQAVMTSPNHRSGTDRIGEAIKILKGDWDVVVNIQGDEPFVSQRQIRALCSCFDHEETQIATLGKRFATMEEVNNPNSPKIVCDVNGYALYFTRSVVPHVRGFNPAEWLLHFPYLKHIGLYAYRTTVLQEITLLPPSPLEAAESLEQLRWLQNGYRIKVAQTNEETIGIDTPDDLAKAEAFLAAMGKH